MQPHQKELLVARIISGSVRCPLTGRRGEPLVVLLQRPDRQQRYRAEEIFQEVMQEAALEGAFTEDELYTYLLENELWDEVREKQLVGLQQDVDNLKVKLFELAFKSTERALARKMLAKARSTLSLLSEERHSFDHLSCLGMASLSRTRYLLGASMVWPDGQKVFTDQTFYDQSSDTLEGALQWYGQNRLTEEDYRELARTDPWRFFWTGKRAEGTLFGISPVDYSEEQRHLVNWTCLYDNIYEHPEAPGDDVIEDNDMLDGWMILQRRKREDQKTKKRGEELVSNEKIRGSQEVYLVANTSEDAKKIDALNDDYGRAIKQQRFAQVRKQGRVNEVDMPDTKQRLRMEITQKLSESMKQKK